MARVKKQQPKGRIITTRGRRYKNKAGAELVEPEGMSERNTVVTRRMSMVREQARKQRIENEPRKRSQTNATASQAGYLVVASFLSLSSVESCGPTLCTTPYNSSAVFLPALS